MANSKVNVSKMQTSNYQIKRQYLVLSSSLSPDRQSKVVNGRVVTREPGNRNAPLARAGRPRSTLYLAEYLWFRCPVT